jgi:multidrug efflux pump subunit AcrA (membrane-fusion protein)
VRAALLLLAPAALLLAGCGTEPSPKVPAADAAVSGERLKLVPARLADTADVPATVTTRDMAEARARIPGVLSRLSVRAGDRVAAGQAIGVITDTRLGQEAAAYGAGVAAADAQAARARADLERIRFLHREGVYAQAKLDEAVAMARAADAQVAAARAQRGAVAAVEGQGVVRAPAAGTVLVPGMLIATITAGPPIIRLDVPEGLGAGIVPGAAVRVSGLAGQAGGETAEGRIVKRYPGIAGGRVRADAALAGLAPDLVGQRVTATVSVGVREGLAVPERFIAPRFGLNFARLLSADGKRVAEVPVEVRPLGNGTLEILSGLKAGDTILAPAGSPK